MLIIDAHLDHSMNALQWNRDLEVSTYTLRTREQKMNSKGRGQGTVALPELRRGRVALSFATLLARSTGRPVPNIDFDTPEQAYAMARGQLAYYRALERKGTVRVVETKQDLDEAWSAWESWEQEGSPSGEEPPLAFMIAMEGADPILDPEDLSSWYEGGLRALGLAHYGPGRYAGGTGTELGLGPDGPALLDEMSRLGLLLDLTHLSDQSFWQALERYDGPVHASHQNCRALVPHQRQFSDEQIRAVIEREGVLGAALDVWMVSATWSQYGEPNRTIMLADIVPHIDHVCQLAGNARHIAIGTDLDGGFGREQSPADLDTIADLQKIPELLKERGYSDDDIRLICHGNWLRLLGQTLPEG